MQHKEIRFRESEPRQRDIFFHNFYLGIIVGFLLIPLDLNLDFARLSKVNLSRRFLEKADFV